MRQADIPNETEGVPLITQRITEQLTVLAVTTSLSVKTVVSW